MFSTSRSFLLLFWSVWGVSSFQNTSPFFYYSTAETRSPSNIPQLIKSHTLSQKLLDALSECKSDTYIIAAQPAVNAADFLLPDAAPHLKRSMADDPKIIKSSLSVSDVFGNLEVGEIENYLHTRCKAEIMNVDAATGSFETVDDMKPRVVRVDFPALPLDKSHRARQLRENDSFLSSLLDLLPSTKYTMIYTTTPLSPTDTASMHDHPSELKARDLLTRREDSNGSSDNTTLPNGPLFTRYQFLTPGLFMGLLVTFFLLGIMTVGLNALASLKVSYGAFEREMGPAAAGGRK